MYAEISAALTSAKTALDIVKAARDLANFNELVSAVSEVNAKLLTAYSAALAGKEKEFALTERVRELEKQIREYENWDAQAKDYKLQEVGHGVFAYVFKPAMNSDKAKHWACAKCFHDSVISILQWEHPFYYKCSRCKTELVVKRHGQPVSVNDV